MSELAYWTAAEAAELDVLTYALASPYSEHRERCADCQPGDCPEYEDWRRHLDGCKRCQDEAPLTFGGPCPRRAQLVAHGDTCPPCNPCPTLTKLAEIAVDWRDGRVLKSKAAWLRQFEREREAA